MLALTHKLSSGICDPMLSSQGATNRSVEVAFGPPLSCLIGLDSGWQKEDEVYVVEPLEDDQRSIKRS